MVANVNNINSISENSSISNALINLKINSPVKIKSHFKTVKIFIASNKNDFNEEIEYLIKEAQLELQQYFLEHGYDLYFIDVNLNYDLDPFIDPYLFQSMLNEIEECSKISDACFFLVLFGNKVGLVPLPLEISQLDYECLKSMISSKDLEYFKAWYYLDDQTLLPCYRLKPLIKSFPNLYNRQPDNIEEYLKELESWKETYFKLIKIIQSINNPAPAPTSPASTAEKTTDNAANCTNNTSTAPPANSNSTKQEKYNITGIEQLIKCAFKNTMNEFFMINRLIDGIDLTKKNAEKYLDIVDGKIDKEKEEKFKKLKEFLANKIDDHHKFKFNLKWKEQHEDIFNIIKNQTTQDGEIENNEKNASMIYGVNIDLNKSLNDKFNENGAESLSKYDDEFQNYLKAFNSIVVAHIKNTLEKKINDELQLSKKSNELNLYQEACRHISKLNEFYETSSIDSNDYTERFKHLISIGSKSNHYPIFLYGHQLSGKTTHLAKLGQIAFKLIDQQKSSSFIVRFFDLTSQCNSFEGLLYSICEHLCLIQKLNPINELKNKDTANMIDYFYKICNQISKSNCQLIILIDDLQDFCVEKPSQAPAPPRPNTLNNHISWLFQQELPPGIHLIATIRHQTPSTNSLYNNQISLQATSQSLQILGTPGPMVSLFLHFYNEKISNEVENYLFELPIPIKKGDTADISIFIKSEFQKCGRAISDEQVQIIIKHLYSSKTDNTANFGTENNVNGSDAVNQLNFSYLTFIIKEITLNKSNSDLRKIFADDRYPKNLESFVMLRISCLEKRFNSKVLAHIFNYITASNKGITEMELIDLLSCNNDFFTEHYMKRELPNILRFPLGVWLLVKYQLSDLLTEKYLDNKITYNWRNEIIKKIMKQRYFNKVDQIRNCHKDIANYFLESFIDKKLLIDMNNNMQIRDVQAKRYICQQPLLYSDTKYNYRRLSELWYHLMNSGDVQRLKEFAFFNFEHLLAKCHGTSLKNMLNDIDAVQRRILDADILLIYSFFKKSFVAISQDPLRLSSEILARLRPLYDDYGEHIKSLIKQTTDWCEQYDSPVLIPLSNWVESPEDLLITRIDHPEGILKIAVTSFNQHVFFSTNKHDICMYHIPSKKLVKKFIGHTDEITFLLLSYNNRFLITGSSDKLVKVWNLGTGEAESTFNMHKSAPLCGVLTHSDEYLITGSYNRLLNVIRIETGDVVHSIENHFDAITALAISQDDNILLSASVDKSIKRWRFDADNEIIVQLIDTISTIYSPITSMALSSDNIFIILACENSSIQVKSLITGSDIHDLSGHYSDVTNLVVSGDSEKVYVGCIDCKLYLFDIKSKELIAILIEQEAKIIDLKISADGQFLFSSSGNTLYVMNLKKKDFMTNRKAVQTNNSSKIIKASAMSKEGDLAITADESCSVNLWNLLSAELIVTIIDGSSNFERRGISKLALSNSRLFSLIAFNDGMISVYDNEMGDIVAIFVEHQQPVKHLFVFEDNRRVLSSDGLNSCKIWYSHSGELLESITVACEFLGISPDMKFCISGPGKNNLKLWGLNNSQVIRTLDHPERIKVYTFTSDSHYVITGGDDNSCKIWELATGKLVQVLVEHDGPITSIAVSSNNYIIVSGSKDKLAIIWDFKDGSVLHKLLIHADILIKVAISEDGNVVITASRDGTISVWSSCTGSLITCTNLQYTLTNLLVSSDCNRMMAIFKDCKSLCILGLTSKWSTENIRSLSMVSLKSNENISKNEIYNAVLPLKPKGLKFLKISKSSSKYLKDCNKINASNANNTETGKNEISPVDEQKKDENKNAIKKKGGIFQRVKKKKQQKTEFSSTLSMNTIEDKPTKKTKICCLL